jgi:hypothetical protein
MHLSDHPLLRRLRALREPRGRTLQVVEALCRRRDVDIDDNPDWRPRLPTDAELAKELKMSESSVRTHLRTAATWIEGAEELETRSRIWLWYWHWKWEKTRESPEEFAAALTRANRQAAR